MSGLLPFPLDLQLSILNTENKFDPEEVDQKLVRKPGEVTNTGSKIMSAHYTPRLIHEYVIHSHSDSVTAEQFTNKLVF